MDTLLIAVIAFLVAVAIYWLTRKGSREHFVSEEARKVHAASRELFDKKSGTVSFSEFKAAVPGAEAVLYTDTRNLWKKGQLTPEGVQSVL